MFNYPIRDKLVNLKENNTHNTSLRETDQKRKQKMAKYADTRNHAIDHNITVVDAGLVTSKQTNYSLAADAIRSESSQRKRIFLTNGNKSFMRTSKQVKRYNPSQQQALLTRTVIQTRIPLRMTNSRFQHFWTMV